ncbi:MAG: hypothetical protein LVQ96_02770 [Thermoplasmatales archaeon]|nr:hypothetical protein [Thermoplasmatales archaeon]MCW6170073.1 hypothetical protein [Thermoplasmatales archaeon]
MKFMKEFVSRFSSKPVFSSYEARNFFTYRHGPEGYYKLVLNNLVRSGRLYRITRGQYSFYDEIQYVGFAFKPFYYGLQDALSIRNLWEQETNPIIITPRRVRSGIRTFLGRNYLLRWIERSMFFGYSFVEYGGFFIPVADPEKILIDMVYYHEFLPEEVKNEILRAVNKEKLQEYILMLPEYLRKRVNALAETEKLGTETTAE